MLSGQLMNNLVVLEADRNSFKIGLTKQVKSYGYYVNEERPFIGLTKDDIKNLTEAVAFNIAEKLK